MLFLWEFLTFYCALKIYYTQERRGGFWLMVDAFSSVGDGGNSKDGWRELYKVFLFLIIIDIIFDIIVGREGVNTAM